ncbi:MAG: GNAT family protein [Bacteroidota bacterium]
MFDFSKEYALENDRVRLLPLRFEHVNALSDEFIDERIWIYFTDKVKDKYSLIHYVKTALMERENEREYPFVIMDKRTSKIAGMTRIYEINKTLKTIKIGHTCLAFNYWGKGVNQFAKYLLFQFAFEHLNMLRIGFGIHGENERSKKAIINLGCQMEGVIRDYFESIHEKVRADLMLFGILLNEWQELSKKIDRSKYFNRTKLV